jgi:hypothetical protein
MLRIKIQAGDKGDYLFTIRQDAKLAVYFVFPQGLSNESYICGIVFG